MAAVDKDQEVDDVEKREKDILDIEAEELLMDREKMIMWLQQPVIRNDGWNVSDIKHARRVFYLEQTYKRTKAVMSLYAELNPVYKLSIQHIEAAVSATDKY